MSRGRLPDAGYLFFGDSFSRIFTLVNHPQIYIKAYKGASAKGLTKPKNENRIDILETLENKPGTKAAIFVFGNVDVHMSYWFCKHGRDPPEEPDFEAIAAQYVSFIASLPGAFERVVIGVYPSSLLEAESVPTSITAYGVLTEEQAATIDVADCTLQKRQGRVRAFNAALRRACEARTSVAAPLTYLDVFDELVEPDTLRMKGDYLDISVMNSNPRTTAGLEPSTSQDTRTLLTQ